MKSTAVLVVVDISYYWEERSLLQVIFARATQYCILKAVLRI